MTDDSDARLDEIAERIFREVNGDGMRARELAREYLGYPTRRYVGQDDPEDDDRVRAVNNKVDEKIGAFAAAAAERIFAAVAGDEDRAGALLREFKGSGYLYHIDRIVRAKFRQLDSTAADAIVERAFRYADGDRALGYELAQVAVEQAGRQGRYFETMVRDRLKTKFVEDRIRQIGDGHPFGGESKSFRYVDLGARTDARSTRFYDVGIEADGQLKNPQGYPEDEVRAALRDAAARAIEKRKEANARAVKTRERRYTERIYKIANGINNGQKYGPASACVCCGRALTDPVSIERGIGPECWDHRILRAIEFLKEHKEFQTPRMNRTFGLPDPDEASS